MSADPTPCRRCQGKGEVVYAYREQGQKEWDRRVRPCPVCLGMGTKPPRRGKDLPDGAIYFHARGGPNRMSMNEVMDRLEKGKDNHAEDA